MAKLSARGRYELVRVAREQRFASREENDLTSWRRKTLALMSDGVVLSKEDARFWPGPYDTPAEVAAGGRLYSWGWKVYVRHLKPQYATPDTFRAWAESKGYR